MWPTCCWCGWKEGVRSWRFGLRWVRDGEGFKFNVTVVLIDLFLREGLIAGAEATELRAALAVMGG